MTNNNIYNLLSTKINVSLGLEQLILNTFDSVIDFQPQGKLTDTLYKLTEV